MMTTSWNGIGSRAWATASLATLAVVLATTVGAQSTTGSGSGSNSQTPASQTPAPPASTPSASTPPASGSPTAQPAAGTTPVGGDQAPTPTAQSGSSQTGASQSGGSAPTAKPSGQPAPGTTPVGGDTPQTKPGTTPVGGDTAATDVKPDKVVEVGSQKINVKPGSIDDVNAVGNRDIGGRGMGNWYSVDTEIKMGKMYADQIEKSTKFITDPVIVEYVNRVGQNIVKNSDCKVPFTIKVIDSDEINAMALPGGFFYVNSGLILAADEEAELAGVMAHETAHVCAHHAAREMTRMYYAQIGSVPLMIMTAGSWTGYGIYEAMQLAIPITFLQFSRTFEAEADWLGFQYLDKAGYDPQAFIQFFEKIDALEKHKPGTLAKVFADHPQTPDRIIHSEEEIATIMPARPDYMVTTSEFDDVKTRLARVENKRKLNDKNNGNKPTLRRTSGSNNDPNNPSTTDNDRPPPARRNNPTSPPSRLPIREAVLSNPVK